MPGSSESIVRLTASLPWQTSCGSGKGENDVETKPVFGTAATTNEAFPFETRAVDSVVNRKLVLPKIDAIEYSVALEGTFPDVAMMSSNILAKQDLVVHLEDKVSAYINLSLHRCIPAYIDKYLDWYIYI